MQVPPRIVRHSDGTAFCITEYTAAEGWLRATWKGYVTPEDAEQGATAALEPLQVSAVPYLLNDNSQIAGPWFDSLDWLQRVWAPQATQLGLRFVAHVMQPHTESDLDTILTHKPFADFFELQIFSTVGQAAAWLHECQQQAT
jgi:hypothetical protein